ncbi:ABC transporter [Natrialba chahannaoensis JCM 10990]|uniref:ABC transporter n=2 Tax=Natrialba chahannaoensis TaxID=68911 RepID=M0AST7_9EURY|nr:ABC transporter [Natrialba chahannaoensis JCM 10990]
MNLRPYMKVKNSRYWVYCLLLFVLGITATAGGPISPHRLYPPGEFERGEFVVLATFQWFVAVIGAFAAVLAGYATVVGDRTSGRIRLLLKLPYTRREYLVRRFLGEAFALVLFTTLAIVAGVTISTALYGRPPLFPVAVFLVLSAGYLLVWFSFATAVSMVVRTGRQAITVVVPAVLVAISWSSLVNGLFRLVPVTESPLLYFFAHRLSPHDAYYTVTNWAMGLPNAHNTAGSVIRYFESDAIVLLSSMHIVPEVIEGSIPWYLSEWVSLLVLVLWGVLPVGIAYWRFSRSDLDPGPSTGVRRLLGRSDRSNHGRTLTRRLLAGSSLSGRATPLLLFVIRHGLVKIRRPAYWAYGLVVVLFSLELLIGPVSGIPANPPPEYALMILQSVIAYLGGIAAVFAGYALVTGDRASGRTRLLLKHPRERWEYVLSKLFGEAVTLVVVTTLALLPVILVSTALYGPPPVIRTITVLVVSGVYLLMWVSIATAISAIAKTGRRAITMALSVFMVLPFFWDDLYAALVSTITENPNPGPYFFTERLIPQYSYQAATNWIAGLPNSNDAGSSVLEKLTTDDPMPTVTLLSDVFDGGVPWYLSEWLSVPILVLWGTVPIVIACWRFERIDLT